MGLLNPLALIAVVAVAVPLLLHLFQRHESRRMAFPAIRYLRRAEREHARTIRFRQILLLLLRIAALVLVALAAARPYVRGLAGSHDPTALALVLDNSMSSGLVVGERRVLDRLKETALRSVDGATFDDRIWVLRAGEPWDVAVPGTPLQARRRILETEVSAAAARIPETLARAEALVRGSSLAAREIHLLSDLQATGFPTSRELLDLAVPVVVLLPDTARATNRYLETLLVGGGLAPLANERSDVAVRIGGTGTDTIPVRLILGERVRGAGGAPPGSSAVLPIGPFQEGHVTGYVETDPDALRADDRRYFSFQVRPPPAVAVTGFTPFFVSEALSVLEEGGRVRVTPPREARILLAGGGAGIEARRRGVAAILIPPADPTLLPAVNRRLASAGIPWRYEALGETGEGLVEDSRLPGSLEGLRIFDHYRLVRTEEGSDEIWVRLSSGLPWVVSGNDPTGPFLLLASPLELDATNLPVTASMIPLLEWMLGAWALPALGEVAVNAGEPLRLAAGATRVVDPDGTPHAVGGIESFRETRLAGIYRVFAGDTLLEEVAVNGPPSESDLGPLSLLELRESIGERLVEVPDPGLWSQRIFQSRQGPELWRPLLVAALLLLLVESWIASAGRQAVRAPTVPSREQEAGTSGLT